MLISREHVSMLSLYNEDKLHLDTFTEASAWSRLWVFCSSVCFSV